MLDQTQSDLPAPTRQAAPQKAPDAALPRPEGRPHWRERLWRRFVLGFDAVLRRAYGVAEFTDNPECVIRVALSAAESNMRLADGTELRAGDPVLVLHFWNEHMLRFRRGRPTLGWASGMRRRLWRSLEALAERVPNEPAWREVRAMRADTALFGFWRMYQARRVIPRFGFEVIAPKQRSRLRAARAFTDDCVVWLLTSVLNPEALKRQEFVRGRDEMWISREGLLRRFGNPGSRAANSLRSLPPAGEGRGEAGNLPPED
jgi:hypothetical protein